MNLGGAMNILQRIKRCRLSAIAALCLFFSNNVFADQSLVEVSHVLSGLTGGLGKLLYGVSFVAGVAFILGGAVQYKYYRDNPQMIRLSTPITYFILGLALIALPFIAMLSSASFATKF